MSNKIKVKFKQDGKWADNPADPVFEVKEGDELEVSAHLANILVESGKGEIITTNNKETPAKEDKKDGKKNPAKSDKAQAESK